MFGGRGGDFYICRQSAPREARCHKLGARRESERKVVNNSRLQHTAQEEHTYTPEHQKKPKTPPSE
jgi:hypothetical protein